MRTLFLTLILTAGCQPAEAPRPTAPGKLRVVSLAPALTEAVFAVGGGPQLVGVTNECDFPPEALAVPKVGGFGPRMLGVEGVLVAKPDVVLSMTNYQTEVIDQLKSAGVTVKTYDPKSVGEIVAMHRDIGEAIGTTDAAEAFAKRLEAEFAALQTAPPATRPKVLIVVGVEPLYCAGPGSFLGQLLTLAGGDNVLPAELGDYPQVGDESILAHPPAVIVMPDNMGIGGWDALTTRPGWSELPAVKSGRLKTLPGDVVSRPGPRILEGLRAFQDACR